jgi:hypothetical protein
MKLRDLILFFLPTVLLHYSCGDTTTNEKTTTAATAPAQPATADTLMDTPARTAPKYSIVRSGSSYADYEVLIDPVELESLSYKKDVEAIVDDLADLKKRSSFTAMIYDNANAAELYYRRREEGQVLTSKENELVNQHIVAQYIRDLDGVMRISYFDYVPPEQKSRHKAWKEAFNQEEFRKGYRPK